MKKIDIRDKLNQIECPVSSLVLGDFDMIGEYTAKKIRSPDNALYKTAGAVFRANYERGLLIYSLIKRFHIKSMLEIGFGRGYSSFCAAKAMTDMGFDDGMVYSVDPTFDENHLKNLSQVFPRDWFKKINLVKGTIDDALRAVKGPWDLIYVDGDHRFDAVKHDWDCVKDKFSKFILLDDYSNEMSAGIQVKQFVDTIEMDKELVITDRRIFFDDRRLPDEAIDYGQVLIKNPSFDDSSFLTEW